MFYPEKISNLPEGLSGYVITDWRTYDSLELATARARLQATSLALLEQHGLPDDLLLNFTAAGSAEPAVTADPLYHR